jgi:DNA-binding NarL/FixJ family response regulator
VGKKVSKRAARARPKTVAAPATGPRTSRIKIVVVDDHPIIREQLAEVINQEPDLQVCGEAATRQEALKVVLATQPDVAIVDLTLPDVRGIDLLKDLEAQAPQVKILVLSMHEESLYGPRALRAGARGYVDKQSASANIVKAIRRVLSGELYLSDQLAQQMASTLAGKGNPLSSEPADRLEERELEVFERIGTAQSTREIAQAMNLSLKTIETYRVRIKRKLKLSDAASLRRNAIIWASRHKLS